LMVLTVVWDLNCLGLFTESRLSGKTRKRILRFGLIIIETTI
jgi:hypothetical protein